MLIWSWTAVPVRFKFRGGNWISGGKQVYRNQKSPTQIFGQSFITEKTQKKKTQWKTDASNALEALSFHGQQSPGKAVLGEFQGNLDLSKPNGSDHLP